MERFIEKMKIEKMKIEKILLMVLILQQVGGDGSSSRLSSSPLTVSSRLRSLFWSGITCPRLGCCRDRAALLSFLDHVHSRPEGDQSQSLRPSARVDTTGRFNAGQRSATAKLDTVALPWLAGPMLGRDDHPQLCATESGYH